MNKKSILVLAMSLVLVVGLTIGGTLAWITDSTEKITNTFTVGDINIELDESENLDLKIIPGKTIIKDPVATVKANSEACWLFVEIEESANFGTYMTYQMAEGWTKLDVEGRTVYYRAVANSTDDQDFEILANNAVAVKGEVTKTQMEAAATSNPTLSFTAYAVQQANGGATFTVAEAWAKL